MICHDKSVKIALAPEIKACRDSAMAGTRSLPSETELLDLVCLNVFDVDQLESVSNTNSSLSAEFVIVEGVEYMPKSREGDTRT